MEKKPKDEEAYTQYTKVILLVDLKHRKDLVTMKTRNISNAFRFLKAEDFEKTVKPVLNASCQF